MEDDYYDNYSDSDRLDEMNTAEDYNRFEENQVWADISAGEGREEWEAEEEDLQEQMERDDEEADRELGCQIQDMEMEDRIGGTGYIEDY